MILTEQDIRYMVNECVSRLTEVRHVIDGRLGKLADMIIMTAKYGGGDISCEAINSCNPYFQIDKPLKVSVQRLPASVNASFYYEIPEIAIDPKTMRRADIRDIIMHELSHFVDNSSRTKTDVDNIVYPNLEFINQCMYYYRPTEIQARLVEYANRLRRNPFFIKLKITDTRVNSALHINEMQQFLDMVKNARFSRILSPEMALVIGLFYAEASKRAMRRHGTDKVEDVKDYVKRLSDYKNISEQEFESRKQTMVKIYEKRLRSMMNKALKIKYDAMTANQ